MRRNKPKSFEMVRSILPSTARKAAREDKRRLQHTNRAQIHNKLTRYKGYADDVIDEYEDDDEDLEFYYHPSRDGSWDHIVYERRAHDKLNHFVRWAGRKIKDMDEHEGWDYLRGIVPPGLIGDHALTHLYMYEPDRNTWRNYRYVPRTPEEIEAHKLLTEKIAAAKAFNDLCFEQMEFIVSDPKRLQKWNKALQHRERVMRLNAEYHFEASARRSGILFDTPSGEFHYDGYVWDEWTPENWKRKFYAQIKIQEHFYRWDYGVKNSFSGYLKGLTIFFCKYNNIAIPD